MKHDRLLVLASLLSVLFFTFHLADDIVRGVEEGGPWNLTAIPTFVTWLYGTLVLSGRRSGYVIMLLGALLGTAAPVLQLRAEGGVAGGGRRPPNRGKSSRSSTSGSESSVTRLRVQELRLPSSRYILKPLATET